MNGSPLMLGGDLPSNDAFTLSLLRNKDILKMHKEGTEIRRLFIENGKIAVTSRNRKPENVIWLYLTLEIKTRQRFQLILNNWKLAIITR